MSDHVSVNHDVLQAIVVPPTLSERASQFAKKTCSYAAKSAAAFSDATQASCKRLKAAWNALRAPAGQTDARTKHVPTTALHTQSALEQAFPGFSAEYVDEHKVTRDELISKLKDGTQSSLLVQMKGGVVCYTRGENGWQAHSIPKEHPVVHADPVELLKKRFPANRKIRAMNFKLTAKSRTWTFPSSPIRNCKRQANR